MPLECRIREILERPAPAGWKPTGATRSMYLDLMQPIVETAAAWQDERGAIIDPVEQIEHGQTSSRFVAPGAILLFAGRCEHLREQVLRGMDWCCMRLASGAAHSPDRVEFTVRWVHAPSGVRVTQRYSLSAMRLQIHASVDGPEPIESVRFTVPLLVTDGQTQTAIDIEKGCARVRHPAGTLCVGFEPSWQTALLKDIANRNGIYRPLVIERAGNCIDLSLWFTFAAQEGTK